MNARHEGIFKSAQEAVLFACHFSSQQYAMSPMAKILQRGGSGSGRGLIGLDGAAQAGMVMAEVDKLQKPHAWAVKARSAPHREQCSCTSACCGGWKPNPVFNEALSWLADHLVEVLEVLPPLRAFRVGVLARYFGAKLSVADLADDHGIPKRTAERHAKAIVDAMKAIEKAAWADLYVRLEDVGMLIKGTA